MKVCCPECGSAFAHSVKNVDKIMVCSSCDSSLFISQDKFKKSLSVVSFMVGQKSQMPSFEDDMEMPDMVDDEDY